jgi:hypothetical protein
MLNDMLELGLSQSYSSDDMIRSAFNPAGDNNLLDANVLSQLAATAPSEVNSPNHPSIRNVLAGANDHSAQLERQVRFHLQEIACRASFLTDQLLSDVIVSNGAAVDVSGSSNPVAEIGFPFYGNSFNGLGWKMHSLQGCQIFDSDLFGRNGSAAPPDICVKLS